MNRLWWVQWAHTNWEFTQAPKKFWNLTNYRGILRPYDLDKVMTKVKYLTLPSIPKGATIYEYPSHHESYASLLSHPVIRSDLIRRRNFRFPFPMKNVFTSRILIWCPYIAFYFNAYLTGAKTILSSSHFESFWPWSSNAMYVLRHSQGNTIVRDTKIQSQQW